MLFPEKDGRAPRMSSEFDQRDGLLSDGKSDTGPPASFEQRYLRLKYLNVLLVVILALLSSFTLYLFIQLRTQSDAILLGNDPFGYVPAR